MPGQLRRSLHAVCGSLRETDVCRIPRKTRPIPSSSGSGYDVISSANGDEKDAGAASRDVSCNRRETVF